MNSYLPEPGAESSVDDEVGRGVDDEEDVGDEAKEDDVDGETSQESAATQPHVTGGEEGDK